MAALSFAVIALGVLTLASFVVFTILLFRYFKQTRMPAAPAQAAAAKGDELQGLDPTKLFDSVAGVINATARLTRSLNQAKPVAISALLTILFLVCWLVAITLLVFSQAAHVSP